MEGFIMRWVERYGVCSGIEGGIVFLFWLGGIVGGCGCCCVVFGVLDMLEMVLMGV